MSLVSSVQQTSAYSQIKLTNKSNQSFKLTDEQKELIIQKKQDLHDKYLKDLEQKTEAEQQQAKDQFRKELKDYIKNELGIQLPDHFYGHRAKRHFKHVIPR